MPLTPRQCLNGGEGKGTPKVDSVVLNGRLEGRTALYTAHWQYLECALGSRAKKEQIRAISSHRMLAVRNSILAVGECPSYYCPVATEQKNGSAGLSLGVSYVLWV